MNAAPDNQSPRRLLRLWHFVRHGLPAAGRYKRYALTIAPFLIVIWGLVFAYLSLAPVSYKSGMTLILPGSGAGGSINLESIGQASAQTSSAFASPSLSPTENYKRLLSADITRRRAAEIIGSDQDLLAAPNIKLVDQTNLILVSTTGPTPDIAQARLEALRRSFLAILSRLRRDERDKREAADRVLLAELQATVRETQTRLLEFQGETGLASLDQFNRRIEMIDDLHAKEREVQADVQGQSAQVQQLADTLDVDLQDARRALLLKADPLFQSLLSQYARLNAEWTEVSATLGDRHMRVAELAAERDALRDALTARGKQLTGLSSQTLLRFADLSVSEGRARVFEELVLGDSAGAAAQARLDEIKRQIDDQVEQSHALVEKAATLSDLLRDRRVAEAVFSSALARLDTNKSDPFASYPLVQTFETPSKPSEPSSPSTVFALAGGIAASFFVLAGFLLLWLRQPLIRLVLPNE